jgi:hypothetical protein
MDTARTTLRTLTAARRAPRLLAVLALAAALVAIPAARPEDAGAMWISERQLARDCYGGGGTIYYEFWSEDAFEVTCILGWGQSFSCHGTIGGPSGAVICDDF